MGTNLGNARRISFARTQSRQGVIWHGDVHSRQQSVGVSQFRCKSCKIQKHDLFDSGSSGYAVKSMVAYEFPNHGIGVIQSLQVVESEHVVVVHGYGRNNGSMEPESKVAAEQIKCEIRLVVTSADIIIGNIPETYFS